MGFNRRNLKPETRNRQRKLVSSDETRNPKPETDSNPTFGWLSGSELVQGAGQDGRRTQTEAATRQGGVATADGGSSGLRNLISATKNSDDVGISCRYDGDECNNMIQSDKYLGLSQNCI